MATPGLGRTEPQFEPRIQRGRRVLIDRTEVQGQPVNLLEYDECAGLHTFFLSAEYAAENLNALTLTGLVTVSVTFGVGGITDTIEFDLKLGQVITLPCENAIFTGRFDPGTGADDYTSALVRSFGVPGPYGTPNDLSRTFPRVTVPGNGDVFVPIPKYAKQALVYPRDEANFDASSEWYFNTGALADVAQSLGNFPGDFQGLFAGPRPIPGGAHFIRIENNAAVARIYTVFFLLAL